MMNSLVTRLLCGLGVLLATAVVASAEPVVDVAALVQAVASAKQGDTVEIGPGEFVLAAPLQPGEGVTLRGSGAGKTTLRAGDDWRAPFDKRPDNETDFRTAERDAYLIDLGDDRSGIRIQDMTLVGPALHGAIYGNAADGLQLSGLEVREFGWSGVRLFRSKNVTIRDNTFTDAGGRVDKTTGGAMFLTYLSDSTIANNRITKTQPDRHVFGIKGREVRRTRIHHNTIGVSFAIEFPFENDYGVEIDHNYLAGVVSIPKHGGGLEKLNDRPIEAGQAFHIHHNIFTKSYSIEGPRNGVEIDHNVFIFKPEDDGGNLISIFGSDFKRVIPGPLSFHDNLVKNPGRGILWSDLPHDRLSFVRNRIVADETTPSQHPEGLFGFRPAKGNAATDLLTVEIRGNSIEVLGSSRDLLRSKEAAAAQIENNKLQNVGDATSYHNPAGTEAPGPAEPLKFDAGVDGEYSVDGFDIELAAKSDE